MSIPVYTVRPGGTATSAVHSHCSACSLPGPVSRYLENEVWSNTATPVRVARCSAATHGSQFCAPQEYSMTGASPGGAKKFGRSQPIRLPKHALASASRWCTGERRNGRAVTSSRFGHGIA